MGKSKKIDNALDSRGARFNKLVGDGDRHVRIYASPDNWRTCYFSNNCQNLTNFYDFWCVKS